MDALVILIPAALILGLGALGVFLWTLRSNQYEDLDGAAWRIISQDDEDAPEKPEA
jgi:cbb3-type cytochrome oxidase maturation protein